MRSEIRDSGIDIIGYVPWGTHFCQFYQTTEDLMNTLIPYLKAGLENNELCIWVVSQSLDVEKAKEALIAEIPNAYGYLEKGQIELVPYTNWYLKEGIFDSQGALDRLIEKMNQSLSNGYTGFRLVENIYWVGKDSWSNDFVNYERSVESVIGKFPMIALCTYSVDVCDTALILNIIANHQFVLAKQEGKWEQIEISGKKSIIELKRTEEALRQSENRYRMLFSNMTDGFCLVEAIYNDDDKPYDYRYLETNPAFELYLGVKREDLLGKTMLETFPNINPIAIEKYNEAALSGQAIHFEIFSDVANKSLDIYVFSPDKGKLALILRDITERKQAENALHQAYEKIQLTSVELQAQAEELQKTNEALIRSENEFRTLAENSPDVIARFDIKNRHLYVNPAAAEVYGYSQEEIIGKTHNELGRDHEQVKIWERLHQKVFATGQSETMEFKITSPQGNEYYFDTRIVPEFINGKVTSVLAISRDITEIKEAEAKQKETLDNFENLVKERTAELEMAYKSLKESERGLAEAQKMAHLGNWEWDIAKDKAYWSDELYRIFGRNPQELAPSYNEYLNYIHPADRDYFDKLVKESLKGQTYGTECEHRIIMANGEERTIHMEVEVILDERKSPVRVKGIIQDITERVQMEEALRQSKALLSAFLEQLPVGVGLANPQGRWLVSNSMLRRYVGDSIPSLDHDNRWRWRTWKADGRLLKESEWPSSRALRGEKVTPGLDFLYTSDDGREIWTRVSSVPFRNDVGEITGVISVMQDIDEQKRAEEALETMEKIRIKEIHHRIKNNLQVISSLLDLQSETFSHLEACKIPEVLEAFMESQNRVTSIALIHEELYKGDNIDTLDFAAYLRKLIADLFNSYYLGNKDISLKLDLDQIYLGMDTAIPLGIVVNELVSNSFKHAFPAGGRGEIRISLHIVLNSIAKNEISSPDEGCLEKSSFDYMLIVADDGKGIPREIDFQKTDSLGLQLVKILVEQIDGRIELEKSNGTEFTIWFNNIEG